MMPALTVVLPLLPGKQEAWRRFCSTSQSPQAKVRTPLPERRKKKGGMSYDCSTTIIPDHLMTLGTITSQTYPIIKSWVETSSLHTLQRDGVRLAYTQAGSGTPPLVFLHGWAGDHTIFTSQFAHFSQTHRTIAVDLRGHGQSDKPEQNYTVASFADDIAWLCSHLGVTKPVIVGHSMGGNIALALAARYPDLPAAILLLDTVVFPLPGLKENALLPVLAALHGSGYRQAIRQAISGLFLPTDDQECKARLIERAATMPQYVAVSAFQNHLITYDASEFAVACQVPVGYIAATNPMADLEQFRSLCPQLVASQVMQAGHFAPLVAPDQINAMIERFLAINVACRVHGRW